MEKITARDARPGDLIELYGGTMHATVEHTVVIYPYGWVQISYTNGHRSTYAAGDVLRMVVA